MRIRELKRQAWKRLQHYYGTAVVICLITYVLGGGLTSSFQLHNSAAEVTGQFQEEESQGLLDGIVLPEGAELPEGDVSSELPGAAGISENGAISGEMSTAELGGLLAIGLMLMGMGLIMMVGGMLFRFFVTNVIHIGQLNFFIKSARQEASAGISTLFSHFSNGWYLRTVANMFLMELFITLWTLLLIIPGIIKSFEYALVPYILGDEPELTWTQARDKSRMWMDGEWGKFFLLQLSFIGWYLLTALIWLLATALVHPLAGVLIITAAILALQPYVTASLTEFYLDIKGNNTRYEEPVNGPEVWS